MCQHGIEMVGVCGEGGRGSLCALVQTDVCVANLTKNFESHAVGPILPRVLNKFVPKEAEVALQFEKGIAYVKIDK